MSGSQKVLLLLFMGFLFANSGAQEVEHAPTVEQCRADQRLWLHELETSESLPDVNYLTLSGWAQEMFECLTVNPENKVFYYNVLGEISSTKIMRLRHFLGRHGLYDTFIEEDKAGKR